MGCSVVCLLLLAVALMSVHAIVYDGKEGIAMYRDDAGVYRVMSRADAQTRCSSFGATLASTAQLEAAWRAGMQSCACGWLTDGQAYPMQISHPSCGNKIGLVSCHASNYGGAGGLDAYCYRVLQEYRITNVNWVIDQAQVMAATPMVVQSQTLYNGLNQAAKQMVKFSYSIENTKNWGNEAGLTLGVSTSFKSGFPGLAEGKVEVSAEASYSHSWGGEYKEVMNVESSAEVPVPARSQVTVQLVATKAKLDIPYTATLTKVYKGGSKSQPQQIKGTYKSVLNFDIKMKILPAVNLKRSLTRKIAGACPTVDCGHKSCPNGFKVNPQTGCVTCQCDPCPDPPPCSCGRFGFDGKGCLKCNC